MTVGPKQLESGANCCWLHKHALVLDNIFRHSTRCCYEQKDNLILPEHNADCGRSPTSLTANSLSQRRLRAERESVFSRHVTSLTTSANRSCIRTAVIHHRSVKKQIVSLACDRSSFGDTSGGRRAISVTCSRPLRLITIFRALSTFRTDLLRTN